MEYLPENKILKYNPDTLVAVRRLYNLDKPGQMDEAIDLLDSWLKKQNHFVRKDFPRDYLERVIILLKGSVERAKAQMDKICTLRTLLPHFFDIKDINNVFKNTNGYQYATFLPKPTNDHHRLYFARYEPVKHTSEIYFQIFLYNIIILEFFKRHDYCDGIIAILDFRDINIMDFVTQINLMELKQVATIVLEGYDTRVKNFFYIATSKTIHVLLKLFKQMISEKMAKRIHVVESVEELHEHVPKELLPSDYGGNEKSLINLQDELKEVIISKENTKYLKEMSKAQTKESMRTSSKYSDDFLGIAGTFRTLDFD